MDKLPVLQATKQSLATHTGLAERVKEKIDSEEFLQVLELEQRILTGGGEGGRCANRCSSTARVCAWG